MTEAEWLTGNDPEAMCAALGGASGRKARLFGVACCRRMWPALRDRRSRRLVADAERYADGIVTAAHLAHSLEGAIRAQQNIPFKDIIVDTAAGAVISIGHDDVLASLDWLFAQTLLVAGLRKSTDIDEAYRTGRAAEAAVQAGLLRCIFGNPFRPVAVEPDWRTGTAVALARSIYDDRAFDRLPVLADALDDAGCDNPDLLGHCRDPALTHVRGCWVVDLMLGLS